MTSLISSLKKINDRQKGEISLSNFDKISNILTYLGLDNEVVDGSIDFYISPSYLELNKANKHKSISHCQFIGTI